MKQNRIVLFAGKVGCGPLFSKTSQTSCECMIDLFGAPPSRADFLTFSKIVRLIRAENKTTQLWLQVELAEEKSQSLHSQKSPQ